MERDQYWSDPDWCSWLEFVVVSLTEADKFLRGALTYLVLLVWFGGE